jgi:hypothetical protein
MSVYLGEGRIWSTEFQKRLDTQQGALNRAAFVSLACEEYVKSTRHEGQKGTTARILYCGHEQVTVWRGSMCHHEVHMWHLAADGRVIINVTYRNRETGGKRSMETAH